MNPDAAGLPSTLDLGAFSMSLDVADLTRSRTFYEALGFVVVGGCEDERYMILKNAETTIGIFQGVIEQDLLTFNPGLTPAMQSLEDFTDVRDIQAHLEAAGIDIATTTDPEGTGPGHIVVVDPDGHGILIDQLADRP